MTHFIKFAVLSLAFATSSANAVVYCKSVGVPKGCVAAPGVGAPRVGVAPGVGVGAPGVGVVDPGINQPGAAGNVGAARVRAGAPGAGVVDPGINQPGAAGNVGAAGVGAGAPGVGTAPANRGGPVDRAGRR